MVENLILTLHSLFLTSPVPNPNPQIHKPQNLTLLSQQDQRHGVVLHDQGKQPISFRSGSRQVSMSVEEVSIYLYFLGGDPIPFILGLSLLTPGLV